jgi:molecular chaperone DnaK (HSP70)
LGILSIDEEQNFYMGIDFGTTNSVVSLYSNLDKQVHTIQIEGDCLVPTAIQFEKDEEFADKFIRNFGFSARESVSVYPESTVLSIKRLLGRDTPVEIVVDKEKYLFMPEDIAGEILGFLKQKTEEFIQQEYGTAVILDSCVITVPANSTDKQKSKTKQAARLAGFKEEGISLRLEPAAAAITYAIDQEKNKKVLIYDFGGGTFDACILDIEMIRENEPKIEIISTYGENNLGGNDIDNIVIDMIYQKFLEQTEGKFNLYDLNCDDGISAKQKKLAQVRMRQVATMTKERLSVSSSVKVNIAPIIQEPVPVNIQFEIDRNSFLTYKRTNKIGQNDKEYVGKSVEDLIDSSIKIVEECLASAKVTTEDIDEIILVGGSSSIPLIREKLQNKFNILPYQGKISPAFSISQGAAYYSKLLNDDGVSYEVTEKTVHAFGLEVSGRRFMEVIKEGTPIINNELIVEAKHLLETGVDDLTSMAISVYEDTRSNLENRHLFVYDEGMKRLAGTTLRGIPKARRGEEKVKVVFKLTTDNILTVMAKCVSTDGVETILTVDELY